MNRELHHFLVDGMIVDYLMSAMADGYDPAGDDDDTLRPERVAAFRLFLWTQLDIAPTASKQIRAVPHGKRQKALDRLISLHLGEPASPDNLHPTIRARIAELSLHHSDEADCSVVAEAEVLIYDAVVTFDRDMRRRLARYSNVPVLSPTEAWDKADIPRGHPPRIRPEDTNPKLGDRWWLWE